MPRLIKIYKIEQPLAGGPMPVILANDTKLLLLYFYSINDDREGVAILRFARSRQHKFGYPNEDVLSSHQYASLGLEGATVYELVDSAWPGELEQMNRIHPLHNPDSYKTLRHFIITFQDSTFECLAADVNAQYFEDRKMKEVYQLTGDILFGDY